MPVRKLSLYLQTLAAVGVGAVAFTALGALIGRGISAVGDPTAAAAVPVIVCAAFGFVVGGAFGCNVALQARGQSRSGMAATVVFVVLLVALVASGALATSTGLPFFAFLPLGPLLAALLASELSVPREAPAPAEPVDS